MLIHGQYRKNASNIGRA